MSPLAMALLRRATAYALVLALLLVSVPRALTFFGLLGPTLDEEIAAADRSLAAARSYGAGEDDPSLTRATKALEAARAAAARNERWEARRSLAEASRNAVDAQRTALATREEQRRAAQKIVAEVDRQLNELEDVYSDVVKGVDKKEEARLFSMMKSTRQRTAGLFLYLEEQAYAKVMAGEAEVKALLAAARQELTAARTARR